MYSCLIVTDDKAETEEYLKLAKRSGGIIKSSIRKGMSYISHDDEYEDSVQRDLGGVCPWCGEVAVLGQYVYLSKECSAAYEGGLSADIGVGVHQ